MATYLTSSVIPAVAVRQSGTEPSGDPGFRPSRPDDLRPLTPPRLAPPRSRDCFLAYAFASVDNHGRLAAQAVMHTLGWVPGTRFDLREAGGLVVATAVDQGALSVCRQGYVRLPAATRHWFGFEPGTRVMLAASPAEGRLVIHPLAALDAMVARAYAAAFGGEPA